MDTSDIVLDKTFFKADLSSNKFKYHGKASDLFKIFIVNVFLLLITLGFYYPWAKAKLLNFHYSATEFKSARFTFHGTGKEMFIGLIKALVIFGGWYGLFQLSDHYLNEYANKTGIAWPLILSYLIFYIIFLLLMPFAIVGSIRYRASRSSWRGIHFQYVGTIQEMYRIMLPGALLCLVTFGVYTPWLIVNIYKEVGRNLRWGTLKFDFKGAGVELLGIFLLSFLLFNITLGLYYFKFLSNHHNFIFNNIQLNGEGEQGVFTANTTGRGYLKLLVGNFFIVLFTLGLGVPFAIIRQFNYLAETTEIVGDIDFDNLQQGDLADASAMGEGLMDALEIDLI